MLLKRWWSSNVTEDHSGAEELQRKDFLPHEAAQLNIKNSISTWPVIEMQEINVQLAEDGIYNGGGSGEDETSPWAISADRNGSLEGAMGREGKIYPQVQLIYQWKAT